MADLSQDRVVSNNQKLYNNLLKSGKVTQDEIGDFNTFNTLLSDSSNASKLRDNLISKKNFSDAELGSNDDFLQNLDPLEGTTNKPEKTDLEYQQDWVRKHPKLNALFQKEGMGLLNDAYIGTKKMIGSFGTTIDVMAENLGNNLTGGYQTNEKGEVIAPWEKEYKQPGKSDFAKKIEQFEKEVPASKGGFTAFFGQMLPQVTGLIATTLLRNKSVSEAYLASMYGTSFGSGIENYDKHIKETGETPNANDRNLVGIGYGAAEYLGEKVGLDYFMPKGYGKLTSGAINPIAAKEIGKNVIENYAKLTKQSAPMILKKIIAGSQIEGGQEVATEGIDIIIDKWVTGEDVTGEDVKSRLFDAYKGGVFMSAGVMPFAHISQNVSTTQRRRQQGEVTIGIDEKGLPLEIIKTENGIIGIRPNGDEIGNISEQTIKNSATFKTEDFEKTMSSLKKGSDVLSEDWKDESIKQNLLNSQTEGQIIVNDVPKRVQAKKEFEQASASFNDIPNANYTEAVKNLLSTYTDPKEIITNFNKISSEIGVEGKEYETALKFLSSSVKVNSLNKAKQAEIQKWIDDFQDDKGNVTSAEIEGEKYYIKNSADLGQPGRIIFAKNQKGEVKPFNASLVKDWSTLTPDQITQTAQQKEAEEDNQFNASQEVSAAASQVGIEPNKSVKTPNGIAKVVSVNNDGTVTVVNQKGLQDEFSIDEVEAYKTEEQKQAEKDALIQQKESEKIQLQQQQEAEKVQAEADKLAQQQAEARQARTDIPKDKEGNPDYSQMEPEMFFEEYSKEFSEEEAKTEIKGMQLAIVEKIKKLGEKKAKATSLNDRAKIAREIKSLTAQLDNINAIVEKGRPKANEGKGNTQWIAKNSTNPDEIVSAYEQEKSNAPVNNLKEWQKFITGVKFNPDSFNRFGDKNNITSTLAKTWLNSDGHDIDQFIRDNFEDVPGFEDVTEQDVIDFITENPTGQLRKTTDTQNELRKRYREITGVSIDNHKFDNETLPTQAKLESFLTENNLNDSWFTTEDLQSLVTENKDKLNENDYNEFTDYLSRELTTKQSELDEWDFDDAESSIQTEISASKDSDSKKLSSTKEGEPIEFSQSSLLNEATPEVKSTEGDASIVDVENIEEQLAKLDNKRQELLIKVEPLVELKKKLYSNVDIESPKSEDEKQLEKQIASIFSEIQSIILEKRKIVKQKNENVSQRLSETPVNTEGATQTSETLLQKNENKQSESEPNFRVQDKSEAQQTIEYLQSIDKSKRNVIYLGKSDIIQYLEDNRHKYSRKTIDQVKNANFSAFYLRDEIFINSDKVKTKEDVDTNWIHERVHAQTKETLNNEELSLLYDQIGLREIQRIIPRIYWLETPNIQADEYISFASETLLANGKLDDKIPSDIQNIILNIVNNITSINNLTNGKNNLDNFQQGIEGRNAYVGDSDRRGTEQDRTDSEGNGVGSGTRLQPDEKGSKVTFSDQANIDLKDRHNAITSITKIGTELNIPVNVVNSSELTSDNGQTALTDNGTVTIVSDRVKSVSEVIKALVKEVAGEKGIREILANADPNSIVGKQLAKYDELSPEELQSDKLAQVIRKAFRFTSGQFSQSDLFNIINEQRERMTEGQKTNIETSETNIENDRTTVNEPKNTYKTKEGQEIQYTLTFGDDNKSTTNDLQQDENRQQNPSLRRLKEGEMASVEMKYTLDKNYIFDGRNKIESAEDIAYLFRQLENKSVENMFACLVDENQKPTIIHISMGGRAGTVIDFGVLADAVSRFSPKKVYLIHNHPSGNLVASDADIQIHTKAKDAFGEDLIGEHVIINTTSGKYASFNHKYDYDTNSRPKTVETPQNYKVLKFDKQVFKDTTEPFKVTGSKSVAKFISAQRFSSGDKLSVLILARNNDIKAYLHLPSVDFSSKESVLGLKTELQAYAGRFGGHSLILSGNTFNIKDPNESRRNIRYLKALLKSSDISLLDLVEVESDLKWVSMADEDLMEPKEKYEDKIEEDYHKWKRKNVTLRGIKELGRANEVYGSFGNGLYTVPLRNKSMAKQYGEVYFVVNAIPKDPKIVNSLNDAELVRQNLVNSYCKKNEVDYSVKYFNEHSSMESEMLDIGYDGLIVKGREMVNYTPENVKYFKTEQELKNYHESLLNQPRFRIIGEQGATNLDKAEEATTRLDNLAIAREMEKGKSIENARLKFFDDIPDELKNDARIVNRGEDANGESMKRIQSNPRAKSAWADYIRAQEHMTEWNSLSEKEQNRRIRLATGWEKGVDGKWRYETDDSDISFDKNILEEMKNNQTLANAVHTFRNLTYRKNEDGSYDFTMVKKGATSISDIATYRNIPNSELEYIFDNNTDLISKVRNGEGQPGLIGAELDESAKELNIEFEHYVSGGTTLGSLIENKEMFKEYPQLKKVVFVFDPKSTSQGSFGKDLDGQDVITVKSLSGNQFKSTLLHEIQHAIQEIEGFAKGGNLQTARNYESKNGLQSFNGYKTYQRLAGEVEARNVQTRMNMTPEERRNALLSETEDVAREDQIVLMDGLGVSKLELPETININGVERPAINSGRDGVVITNIYDNWSQKDKTGLGTTYAVFSPDQILIESLNDDIRFRIDKASEGVNTNPTDAQKESGNYKKGHIKFDGFDISIENPKGSTRSGVDQDGNKWSNQMGADYGYIKGTVGKDKDHIDVFIGNKPELNKVYVVDQINPKTGNFDESKVMLGFDGVTEARKAYQASYPKDWKGLNNITRTTKEGLKDWFENGNTKKPFADGDVRFRMAYHGSPHQFDKFTTEKIGTGEGAQAFGWGLYFTDKKSIAEDYAKKLGQYNLKQQYQGMDVEPQSPLDSAAGIINDYQQRYNTIPRAIKRAEELKGYVDKDNPQMIKYWDGVIDWLRHSKISDFKRVPNSNLYSVELHQGKEPGEYDYLRWDKKPTDKQKEKITKQAENENIKLPLYWKNDRGINELFYANLKEQLGSAEAASKFLLRAGIDGIQYPTEVTTKGSHEESFNYVIFDENAVEVKELVRFRQSNTTKDLSSIEQLSDIAFKVSQKSANTVPENQNENTEKAMNKAHGLKGETILSKIDRWKQEVKETTQHFKYVTEKEFPQIYNDLRLFESIPEVVKKDAYDKIADIVRPIANDKNLYKAFERYVVISDLMHDIKSGIYTNTIGIKEAAELKGVSEKEIKDLIESGAIKTMPHEKGQRYQLYYDSVLPGAPKSDTYKQLPFSMKSVDEVETYYNELREYIDKNPSLRKVIANRNSIIYKVRDQLIENNLMSEKARDNTSYFHHMVMKYRENPEKSTAINQSYDVRVHPRGWQKSRTGSMEDYNTDYLQSEFEVIAQSLEQLAVKKSLQKIGQEVDIMPALVAQANNEGGSWRDFVPEGYTTWHPKPGTNAWAAASMAEKAIQSVIEGNPLTESLNEQLAEADQTLWVIPTAVANQLDEMKTPTKEKLPIRGMRFFNSTWKQWILLNPARLSKYMINNLSGDLDIVFAYNPKILQPKYAWTAAKELYNEATGKGMSKDMREAIENAVISSGLSIQEIPDVNKEGVFKTLTGDNNLFNKYWNTATSLNDFREGMLRLAAYKFFKEELNAGKTHHGVSNPKAVDALRSNEEKAGKMARELLGDYGNLSQGGVWLRSHAYPFWSWMEINAPRYYKLLRNSYQETNSAPRTVGAAIRKTAISSTALAARIMLLSALITAWNRLFFPDEDDELTKTGNRQLRLITGRRDDGSIITLRIQGAFSDVLSFVGLEDAFQDVKDVRTGKTTAGKKVKEAGSAFVNRVGQGAMPFERLTGELITGKSVYPDILHPRPIIDRAEHAFRMVSLDKVYRFMTKKPLKKGGKELIGLVLYETDPGEAAYYAMRQRIYNFLDEKEYERPSGDPTEKSIALRYYKQAKKFKDTKLENHWLAKYKALGGTTQGMKTSIKKGEVTNALPREYKKEFLDKLDGEDREVLEMAERWYNETYKK